MARRPWPQEAAARNRCRSRATWASGQAGHHERRCLSPWPWRPNVPLVGDEARRVGGGRRRRGRVRSRSRRRGGPRVPTALSTGSGPARLARPRAWDSPSRPSSRQPALSRARRHRRSRRSRWSGVSAVTVPTAGAVRESATTRLELPAPSCATPAATLGVIVAVQLALFLRAAVPDDQVLDRGAEGGAVPERGPGGAPADGPGAAAAGRPGDDQAAGSGYAKRFPQAPSALVASCGAPPAARCDSARARYSARTGRRGRALHDTLRSHLRGRL